ncbi:MAG: hypothetical protein JNK05_18840 [Myxococcales bacterium]|nr:hypothetical protein [Myxococcales bacterium]
MYRRWTLISCAALALSACSPTRISEPDASRPNDVATDQASTPDATSANDASDVADARDEGVAIDARDAGAATDVADASVIDASDDAFDGRSPVVDASDATSADVVDASDTSMVDSADALADSGTDGAGPDASDGSSTLAPRTVACAPVAPPGTSGGLSLSSNFWPGFRFEITGTAVELVEIGGQFAASAPGGTIHATVVRLTGPSDTPDAPGLTGPDVVTRVSITVGAAPTPGEVRTAAATAMLAPGWYAVVYGTGAFGATLTNATIPSTGGGGCTLLPSTFPFTIRQSDGSFVLQGAEPHMFVRVR